MTLCGCSLSHLPYFTVLSLKYHMQIIVSYHQLLPSGRNYHDFSPSGELVQKGVIRDLFRRRQRAGAPRSIQAAVIVPPNNNHVFLFNGRQYWRLNDEDNRIDQGYPQPLTRWSRSLKSGFTAVFYSSGLYTFCFPSLLFICSISVMIGSISRHSTCKP